jgi:uncharacterized protein
MKLYKTTGIRKYLILCEFFLNERGKQPSFLLDEETFALGTKDKWFHLDYHQAHAPIREQTTAEGHAVRAMYLYTAMADLALKTGKEKLNSVLKELWENVTSRRMYITGGLGSQAHGERFTIDYDLPNDVAYSETCASIGLIFWAHRMLQLDLNAQYGDVIELALYNNVLSGISKDGRKYLYVNPLEFNPEAVNYRYDHKHVASERVGWFGCACCPPNIARLLTSLGQYIYSKNDNQIQLNLYIGSEAEFEFKGKKVKLLMQTKYPQNGNVLIDVIPEESMKFDFSFRVPGWCKEFAVMVNEKLISYELQNGYCEIAKKWEKGDKIQIEFQMKPEKIRSNPKVRGNAGKIAIKRGPIVFCIEEIDNGKLLSNLSIPRLEKLVVNEDECTLEGTNVINIVANRIEDAFWRGELYSSEEPIKEPVTIKAVPYYYWGNRENGEMSIWIREN